jgi:hypothetical protein
MIFTTNSKNSGAIKEKAPNEAGASSGSLS